jgi:hypothetical protein
MDFINSFQSEWLKKKRSLATWLVVAGAFFTPSIILLSRIKNADKLAALYASDDFWQRLWNQTWESMAVFLLPVGIILATALIVQIEYKNNAWKQLHTTPQRFATIFFAKFLVILIMLVEVFVLFNVGMYLQAPGDRDGAADRDRRHSFDAFQQFGVSDRADSLRLFFERQCEFLSRLSADSGSAIFDKPAI